MTAEQIAGAIIFFITVSGVLWGVWWRIEGKVKEAKNEASMKAEAAAALAGTARQELAEYRTHVAETFVTKQGQKEQTETMLIAINGIRTDIKGLNDRIDRIFESGAVRQSRPRSGNG